MKVLEWVGLGIVVLLLIRWLMSGGASSLTGISSLTKSWGSGMTFPSAVNYTSNANGTTYSSSVPWWEGLKVGYSEQNGVSAGFGF